MLRQRFRLPILAALPCLLAASPAAAALFINADRTVANGNPVTESFPAQNVFVGLLFDGTRVPGVHVDILSPASFPYSVFTGGGINFYSNSIGSVQGGSISVLAINDQSVVNITGGSLGGIGIGGDTSRVTLSGGTITSTGGAIAVGINGGNFIVNPGATIAANYSIAATHGLTRINGGTIGYALSSAPSVNQYGVNASGDASIDVRGGTINGGLSTSSTATTFLRGGIVNNGLLSSFGGVADVRGGTVHGGVIAAFNSHVDTSGGAFDGDFQTYSGGSSTVRGGTFGGIFALLGSGNMDFFGAGLSLTNAMSGIYTGGNTYYGAPSFTGTYYRLTGILQDGTAIDQSLFRADGATGTVHLAAPSVAAPEPGTFALLALPGALCILRRRKRRI